jgi:2'-5' RNA ligase
LVSIWLIPAPEDAQYLQAIINNLAVNYQAPVFDSHCTLYSRTNLPAAEVKQILEQSAKNIKSFCVKKATISHTENIWKTIFIELLGSPELEQLQQAVISQFPKGQPYEFLPHISLLYKEIPDKKKEDIIRNLQVKNSFKMDKIAAVRTGPNVDNWATVVEIPFHA